MGPDLLSLAVYCVGAVWMKESNEDAVPTAVLLNTAAYSFTRMLLMVRRSRVLLEDCVTEWGGL